jgi:oligoendopeptidase F
MSDTQRVPRRDEIPAEYTWDLTTVYASDAAWEAEIAQFEADLPQIIALQGSLGADATTLLKALQLRDNLQQRLWQLYIYAGRRSDSDNTDPRGQALSDRAGSLVARASASMAFIEPEILAIAEETLSAWQAEEPGLAVYGYALAQLAAQRPHIRSAEVEGILAEFGDITRAPSDIFEMLTTADLEFGSIEDEHGQTIQLSHARFGRLLESQDQRVRRDAFQVFYKSIRGIRNTLGTTLAAEIRSHALSARLRGFGSALEAALKPNDIPLDVYHNLISTVNANLPRLHRYVRMRKQLLGLNELHFYDMYHSLVPSTDVAVPYAEGQRLMLEAFKPLGSAYGEVVARSFTSRWIDVYENQGKRSGAYSDGSYTTAPFILLNYQDKLRDAYTLAHELGHSMHSYFTRKNQPFVYGNYTIFVAEVASTLNEALLTDYLLKTSDDRDLRRALIIQQIDDIRMTLFRQTMFAEFELDMHRRVEAGEPLTADNLSGPYAELVGRYYGPDMVVDEELSLEWARIPHFYYNFYVYQYATGLAASLALSKQILSEGQPAVDRYLKFLSSGSSRSSIDLLRGAGVDMASPAPIQAAMETFDQLMDEFEALA